MYNQNQVYQGAFPYRDVYFSKCNKTDPIRLYNDEYAYLKSGDSFVRYECPKGFEVKIVKSLKTW